MAHLVQHDSGEGAGRRCALGERLGALRWLDPYLGGKYLDEIDRTLIDRIKFDREKRATSGTTNRYLALTRAILRRACNEWEWTERVPKFKLFKEAEGRVRSLTPQEFERLRLELPPILQTWPCSP